MTKLETGADSVGHRCLAVQRNRNRGSRAFSGTACQSISASEFLVFEKYTFLSNAKRLAGKGLCLRG